VQKKNKIPGLANGGFYGTGIVLVFRMPGSPTEEGLLGDTWEDTVPEFRFSVGDSGSVAKVWLRERE
jgi:hypothetical protein